MADEFDALIKLLRGTSSEAAPAAEQAAATVYRDAARAAAPVLKEHNYNPFSKGFGSLGSKFPAGQLRDSIKIIQGKETKELMAGQNTRTRRLFVGPEKKKGYYGYWLAKGWKSAGSRRRKRTATGTTHSQAGSTKVTIVPAPHKEWFERATSAADARAVAAAEQTFNKKLRELDNRTAV